MKNIPNNPKQAPIDIRQVHSFLQDFRTDLTDVMMMAVDEWSAALQDDIRAWQEKAGPEPGWQGYRDWMNEICREDVMPILFPELPADETRDEHTDHPAEGSPQPDNPTGFMAGKGDAHDYIPDWMSLPDLYGNEGQPNPMAIIKLFTPWSNWTWFVMENDGEDLCFGLVVGHATEIGYFSIKEMEEIRGPAGLRIERDLWFRPTPVRELPEYKQCWGNAGPYSGEATAPDQPSDSPTPPEPGNAAVSLRSESCATPSPELPNGWITEDIHFLLDRLAEGPILVAQTRLGIPTIHDNFGAETRHLGFGVMQVEGDGYILRFDAGGAMQRTPSGQGWTRLIIDGQYNGYNRSAVRQTLSGWLIPESRVEKIRPEKQDRSSTPVVR